MVLYTPNKVSASDDKLYISGYLCPHLGRRVRTTLAVPNFCLGLGLLRHLRQATTSRIDEPVTDLQLVSFCLYTIAVLLAYLTDCQAGLAHEDLFFLFGRIWVRNVFCKPHPQSVCHSLWQITSTTLLFSITLLGRTIIAQRVTATAAITEWRPIGVLT